MEEETTSDDLYGDLDLLSKNIKIDQLRRESEEKDALIKSQADELDQVKSQLVRLLNDKRTAEYNLVAIYNTAIRELQRKDREINELKDQMRSSSRR